MKNACRGICCHMQVISVMACNAGTANFSAKGLPPWSGVWSPKEVQVQGTWRGHLSRGHVVGGVWCHAHAMFTTYRACRGIGRVLGQQAQHRVAYM